MTAPFQTLLEKFRDISALSQISGQLSWDQETMMPEKGGQMRAVQNGVLAAIGHDKISDPEIGKLLSDVDVASLDERGQADFREMQKDHHRAVKIPKALSVAIADTTTRAQGLWADARGKDDFKAFAPILKEVLNLRREEAACIRVDGQSDYDALLGDYEHGSSAQNIGALFDELQPDLRALRAEIADKPKPEKFDGKFDKDEQMTLAREIAAIFQYPFEAGRIDVSTHPFSSGNFDDTRITTRVDEADPLNCLYSTVHEVGHSVYEYGISRDLMYRPSGVYASMGVHESQSRFFENQVGRSRAFMDVLAPKMNARFGKTYSPEELYRKINAVSTGYIRTEADEVHYNLHVILRFGLEQDLINGALEVDDLENEWNARFERDFGLKVDKASNGVLQDVHWSVGLFGYFPTYALGNIYAACLLDKIDQAVPDLYAQISKGENGAWIAWLRENIHQHGRLMSAENLVEKATGKAPNTQSLITYLRHKFGELYDL